MTRGDPVPTFSSVKLNQISPKLEWKTTKDSLRSLDAWTSLIGCSTKDSTPEASSHLYWQWKRAEAATNNYIYFLDSICRLFFTKNCSINKTSKKVEKIIADSQSPIRHLQIQSFVQLTRKNPKWFGEALNHYLQGPEPVRIWQSCFHNVWQNYVVYKNKNINSADRFQITTKLCELCRMLCVWLCNDKPEYQVLVSFLFKTVTWSTNI